MRVALELPLFVECGPGLLDQAAQLILARCGNVTSILVVSGPTTVHLYGSSLSAQCSRFVPTELLVVDGATMWSVHKVSERIRAGRADLVVGLGGGKVLDTAKYAASLCGVGYVAVPTSLSSDSVASPVAVLKDSEGKGHSLSCHPPRGVVIDTNVLAQSPAKLLRAGAGDVIANITALFDWKLARDRVGEAFDDVAYLFADSATQMVLAIDSATENESFLRTLVNAILLDGVAMIIAGSSRPCSGSEHLFSHALDHLYGGAGLHGVQVALGSLVCAALQGQDWRSLRRQLERLGLPVAPAQLGLKVSEVIDALVYGPATRPGRYTILSQVGEQEIEDAVVTVFCAE